MAAHGGGGGVRRQKFFKVLLPGSFESSLRLPPKFAARLECPGGGATATATATLRDTTGRPWDVDLHRDGFAFAGRGWRGFVAGCGLSAGHLLVFEHLGGLDFAVDPFDASGCLLLLDDDTDAAGACSCHRIRHQRRDYLVTAADVESGNDDGCRSAGTKRKRSPITATSGSGSGPSQREDETLRRQIRWPYQLRYLDLTKSFCDRVGWTSSRAAELSVAGGKRRWEVSVKVTGKGGMICGGWMGFAQDNRLNISDTCVFKPGSGNLLQVQVVSPQLLMNHQS